MPFSEQFLTASAEASEPGASWFLAARRPDIILLDENARPRFVVEVRGSRAMPSLSKYEWENVLLHKEHVERHIPGARYVLVTLSPVPPRARSESLESLIVVDASHGEPTKVLQSIVARLGLRKREGPTQRSTAPKAALRIAALLPITHARLGEWGIQARNGLRLAARHVANDAGLNIDLILHDISAEDSSISSAFQRVKESGGADAVIGPITSEDVKTALDFAERLSVPLIAPAATATTLAESSYFFRACFTDKDQAKLIAARAAARATDRIAVLSYNEGYSSSLAMAVETECETGGVDVVALRLKSWEDSEVQGAIRQIKHENISLVFVAARFPEVGSFVAMARGLELRTPIWAGDAADSPLLFVYSLDVEDIGEVAVTTHFAPQLKDPAVRRFLQDYGAEFYSMPGVAAALAYDSLSAVARNWLRREGDEKLVDLLTGAFEVHGLTGPIRLRGHGGVDKRVHFQRARGRIFFPEEDAAVSGASDRV